MHLQRFKTPITIGIRAVPTTISIRRAVNGRQRRGDVICARQERSDDFLQWHRHAQATKTLSPKARQFFGKTFGPNLNCLKAPCSTGRGKYGIVNCGGQTVCHRTSDDRSTSETFLHDGSHLLSRGARQPSPFRHSPDVVRKLRQKRASRHRLRARNTGIHMAYFAEGLCTLGPKPEGWGRVTARP